MWTSPRALLPAAGAVVVCIDAGGLYFAYREQQAPDSKWIECTVAGESTWMLGSEPPSREPEWWVHLPPLRLARR